MLLRLPLTFNLVISFHLWYQWSTITLYTLYGLCTLNTVWAYLEYTFSGGILPLFVLHSALLNIIYTICSYNQEAGNHIVLMLGILMLGGQCMMAIYPIVHQDTILMMNRDRKLLAN